MEFTEEEYASLARYQDNDYIVINSLLRSGYSSEKTIDDRKNEVYPYITKAAMDDYLTCIVQMYSAILRAYQTKGCVSPDKVTYRGTQIEVIESMNEENCSFVSTTTSFAQTRTFSMLYHKTDSDPSRRAIAIVEGNVPWIDMDELIGGMENEIIYVPAKVQVKPIETGLDSRLGKTYRMTLTELEIPKKTPEEITEMRNKIIEQTETMSDYLRLILEAEKNPSLQDNKQVEFANQEYNKWKNTVIEYNYQQYRLLKEKIINNVEVIETNKKH